MAVAETDQIEEVDTRGEDDPQEGLTFIQWQIKKLGMPWNRGIDITRSDATRLVKQAGEDARKLEELRNELNKTA